MTLSPAVSKSAALALLFGVLAAAWLMLVQPLILSFFEHSAAIERSREMLARYQGLASTKSELDSSLQALQAAQKSEERLLRGGSAQLVGAKLQNSVKEFIEQSGGALTSMQVLPVREEEGFQRVSISIALTATIESLRKILFLIEDQNPYLFIENLEIRTNRGLFQGGDGEEEGARNLQVHFDVFGYMGMKKV